jgi:hypothetical protein
MSDESNPLFPVGTLVTSHVFHDPDQPKRVAVARWDGVEHRYTLVGEDGALDCGYLAKDLTAAPCSFSP